MIFDIGTWATGAVIVVGIIQWIKGLAPQAKPSTWSIILPVISFLAAVAFGFKSNTLSGVLWDTAGIWAISQLGYEIIVQSVKKRLS